MRSRVATTITQGLAKMMAGAAMIAAAVAMVVAVVIPATSARADDAADFATWSDIAEKINSQLDAGVASYQSGDTATASADFSAAYSSTYVATYFVTVVRDVIGSDKQQSQAAAFTEIKSLTLAKGNDAALNDKTAALKADLTESGATLDAKADLVKPAQYAQDFEAKRTQQREQLDAAKVNKNAGKGDRTWTDVANEMVPILDQALKDAQAGDGKKGADGVNNAYYQYYEKLGFEKNVMNAISGSRVSEMESTFKEARKAMIAGEDASPYINRLKAGLVEDATKLDGGAERNVSGFQKFVTSSIGQSFIILIREGLEALLVVAAVIAYLLKSGNKRLVKWIYLGVVVGLAGAGVIAVVLNMAFGGFSQQQEIMEGVCALIAMVMLLWTSNWMLNKSSVAAWNRYIERKTEVAVGKASSALAAGERITVGMAVSLAMLSFLAVFREGAETVIFFQSIYSMSQDAQGMWIGGVAAAVVLLVIFFLIRFTSVRIPIGPFFLVTSILMAVLVVIFAGGGVHALIEGDLVSGTYLSSMPTNDWLGFYPYAETIVAQAVAAVVVIALFAVGLIKQRKN